MERYTFMSHRGFYELYPENSMAGCQCAWDFGIIPEIDLRLTKDGQVVGFHDETLFRVTNAPVEIAELPLSEINYADIKNVSLLGEGIKHYPIPTLREILYRLGEKPDQKIILDCKDVSIIKQVYPEIVNLRVQGQVIFLTNSVSECRKLKRHLTGIETLLCIKNRQEEMVVEYRKAITDNAVDWIVCILENHPTVKGNFQLSYSFLDEALHQSFSKKYPLTLYHRRFEKKSLEALLALGFTNFATEHIGSLLQLLS